MLYFSPAKLNLFFRVLSRRSDGYHAASASLYQTIDLGDTLDIEKSTRIASPAAILVFHAMREFYH